MAEDLATVRISKSLYQKFIGLFKKEHGCSPSVSEILETELERRVEELTKEEIKEVVNE